MTPGIWGKRSWISLCFPLALAVVAVAQASSDHSRLQPKSPAYFHPNTTLTAQLTLSLDAKRARPGDKVVAEASENAYSGMTVIIPRKSRLIGHVTAVQKDGKEHPGYRLGFVFDRVQLQNGSSFPITGVLEGFGPYMTEGGNGAYGTCALWDQLSRACIRWNYDSDTSRFGDDFTKYKLENDSSAGPVIESKDKDIKLHRHTWLTIYLTIPAS